jgi:hypothetical protein
MHTFKYVVIKLVSYVSKKCYSIEWRISVNVNIPSGEKNELNGE